MHCVSRRIFSHHDEPEEVILLVLRDLYSPTTRHESAAYDAIRLQFRTSNFVVRGVLLMASPSPYIVLLVGSELQAADNNRRGVLYQPSIYDWKTGNSLEVCQNSLCLHDEQNYQDHVLIHIVLPVPGTAFVPKSRFLGGHKS